MLGALLLVAALVADSANPIDAAIERYRKVDSYQVTLKSSSGSSSELIRYYFRKPGFVRMEFEKPFKGAVLIYDPAKKEARLWPFGYRSFPAFTLSPENRLIRSSTGQRVDKSDVGALYQNVKALHENGKTVIAGTKSISGKETLHVVIEGKENFAMGSVHRYHLWLDQSTGFPVKVASHDVQGDLIETVEMEDLQLDPALPEGFFSF